jgi:hypothetical protein
LRVNSFHGRRASNQTMSNAAWLWFAGCAAWTVDGIVSLRLRSIQHAQLAFMVALAFLAAGFFYRRQKR